MRFKLLSLTLTTLLVFGSISQARAQSDTAAIDELATKIVDREIEMHKLNAQLHLNAANPNINRARRVWAYDMGNGIPTEAGLISASALFYAHSNDQTVTSVEAEQAGGSVSISVEPKKVRNHVPDCKVGATLYPQIAGQVIGGTGSFFELGADCHRSIMLRRRHLNRAAVTARVLSLHKEIEELQRQYDLSASTSANAALYAEEGKVLKDAQVRAIHEFVRLQGKAANLGTGQFIEDGASFTRNSIGIVGNSVNVAAVFRNNKRLNGEGAILNLISASIITTRPFMSNLGSLIATKYSARSAKRSFPDEGNAPEVDYDGDRLALARTASTVPVNASISKRLSVYDRLGTQLQEDEDLAKKEEKQAKQTIARRFRESIYGPTKMAQSMMNIVIGFRKQKNSTADNRLSAAANTTYVSGQFLNILELVRERYVDEVSIHELAQRQMLPQQRLARSLQNLDSMQAQLHK